MAKNFGWSKTAALTLCVTLSAFCFSGSSKAATFNFAEIAEGNVLSLTPSGTIAHPEFGGNQKEPEGNWNEVVPQLLDGTSDTELTIDGIGVTAFGYTNYGTSSQVTQNAFLDSYSGGPAGLGVCSTTSCTTGSSRNPLNTADDNVSNNGGGETLELQYSTAVTYNLDELFFRNANHGVLNGDLSINDIAVSVVGGYLTNASKGLVDLALSNTLLTWFTYTDDEFYLSSATVFGSSSVVPIPLPASLPLLGGVLGLFGLLSWRRRRMIAH